MVNIYQGFIRDQQDMELIPGIADKIRKINESGYLAMVVTLFYCPHHHDKGFEGEGNGLSI